MKLRMSEVNQDKTIKKAIQIMEHRLKYNPKGDFMESPEAFKQLLLLREFDRVKEVFTVLYLDNRHRLIAIEEASQGTIDSAHVYPREIIRSAIKHNCAAVALAHGHPSGIAEPSRADIDITKKLQKVLAMIDVRVLDHLIVGAGYVVSLAERGEM